MFKVAFPVLLFLAAAGPALADPCKAIPDRGPLPVHLYRGAAFSGLVVYVGDGDSLCVATGDGPANWVEVRLEDFYAPELHEPGGKAAKAELSRVVMGRKLQCRASHRSYDRIVATCWRNGILVSDLLRSSGGVEGGRGFHH